SGLRRRFRARTTQCDLPHNRGGLVAITWMHPGKGASRAPRQRLVPRADVAALRPLRHRCPLARRLRHRRRNRLPRHGADARSVVSEALPAGGVYTIFDRLDLIPEDPDKIITLSLTASPPAQRPWVSSDFEK